MLKFTLMVLITFSATSFAVADDDAPRQDSAPQQVNKIGIVDIDHLFKCHSGLKKQLADLTAEGELLQAKYDGELSNLKKALKIPPGGEEFMMTEDFVKGELHIKEQITLKRKEFAQRKAKLYLDAYQQIQKEAGKLAKSKHLTIVMNANLSAIQPDNPDEVARDIANKLVWFDGSIDLTPELEKTLSAATVSAK